jgi:flagellar basal body-associated protein FliL
MDRCPHRLYQRSRTRSCLTLQWSTDPSHTSHILLRPCHRLQACFPGGDNDATDGIDATTPLRLPRHCSEQCARIFLDWYAGCGHDNTHPLYPSWVWDGFAAVCEVTLAPDAIQCVDETGTRVASVPVWQQCDGSCDCPHFCEDEGVEARAMIPDSNDNILTCREAYVRTGFADALSCPSHTDMAAGTDNHCTCRNHMVIPVEWRCDGEPDCSLGEDETDCEAVLTARLQRDYALASGDADAPLYAFGLQPMFVTPENLRCSERFITEVVGVPGTTLSDACDFGMDDIATCTAGCANRLIPWAEDCAHADMLPPDEVVNLANYLLCCFKADEQGTEYTCPTADIVDASGMITPNCGGGQTDIRLLGDGSCDTELDCGEFQQDFGDCEVRLLVDMPFTVSGAITERVLLRILTSGVDWMSPDDIEVVNITQTIVGTIDITEPTVNSFSFSNNAAAASQLKQGFKYWLGLSNIRGITLNQPCDLSSTGVCLAQASGRRLQQRESGNGVRIGYTIVAAKDAAASMFGPNNGAADLANAIARAPDVSGCPDVLPKCLNAACTGTRTTDSSNCAEVAAFVASPVAGNCPTSDGCTFTSCNAAVVVANPTSITTVFVLRMSVTEQEFENAMGTGVDTSYQALQTAFTTRFVGTAAQTSLQTALQLELSSNGVYGGMTVPPWAASATLTVPASDKDFTFQVDERRPPPPPQEETAITEEELAMIAVVFIVILVVVLVCGCGGGIFFFSRRSSKVVIMDEHGNIISTFETKGDAEDLEGEVLQKMLADHIAKTQIKFHAKQELDLQAVQMQAEILAEIVVDSVRIHSFGVKRSFTKTGSGQS